MRTIRNPRTRTRHCIFERHPFKSGRPLSWDVDITPKGVRLYYRCRCSSINEIKNHEFEKNGFFLRDCLVCPKCHLGIYAYLKGWEGKDAIMEKAVARRRA